MAGRFFVKCACVLTLPAGNIPVAGQQFCTDAYCWFCVCLASTLLSNTCTPSLSLRMRRLNVL